VVQRKVKVVVPLSRSRLALFGRWWRRLGCAGGIVSTTSHVVGFRFSENHVVGGCVVCFIVSAQFHEGSNIDLAAPDNLQLA
jgi:hypothetical protein